MLRFGFAQLGFITIELTAGIVDPSIRLYRSLQGSRDLSSNGTSRSLLVQMPARHKNFALLVGENLVATQGRVGRYWRWIELNHPIGAGDEAEDGRGLYHQTGSFT